MKESGGRSGLDRYLRDLRRDPLMDREEELPVAREGDMNAPTFPEAPGVARPPSVELAAVREMLSDMDALTAAGQGHVMGKVVALVDGWIGQARQALGARNEGALAALADQLRRESLRPWPDPSAFRGRAERLVALLAAATA